MNTARMLSSQIIALWAPLEGVGANDSAPAEANQLATKQSLLDLSLEELMDVELRSTAALTQISARLDTAASVFVHYNLELLIWSGHDVASVGTQREFGFELEANYHTDRTRLGVSHGFTKLYDFDLESAIEPGWEKGYRGGYFLNLGLQYRPCKNLTFRVDGYNLLGLFDKDLNKRNYYTSLGDYRSEAAAVAVWMIYQF